MHKILPRTIPPLGYNVLAPLGNHITHYAGTFEVLDTDATKLSLLENRLGRPLSGAEAAHFLEALFLRAVVASDLCYVVGQEREGIPDGGYIGSAVAIEMGVALAHNVPLYGTTVSPTLDAREGYDSNFAYFVSMITVAEPEAIQAPGTGA